MDCRHRRDPQSADLDPLQPVELHGARERVRVEIAGEPQRHHHRGAALAPEPVDRPQIEMVVVVVRQQQHVDRRQQFRRQAGPRDPLRAEPGERRSAAVKYGSVSRVRPCRRIRKQAWPEPGDAVGAVRCREAGQGGVGAQHMPGRYRRRRRALQQTAVEEATPVCRRAARHRTARRIAEGSVGQVMPGGRSCHGWRHLQSRSTVSRRAT